MRDVEMKGLDQFLFAMSPVVSKEERADVAELMQHRWTGLHGEIGLNWVVHGEREFKGKRK